MFAASPGQPVGNIITDRRVSVKGLHGDEKIAKVPLGVDPPRKHVPGYRSRNPTGNRYHPFEKPVDCARRV